jgi:hypothetical protein
MASISLLDTCRLGMRDVVDIKCPHLRRGRGTKGDRMDESHTSQSKTKPIYTDATSGTPFLETSK